jgi:hypothetical protein
VVTWQRGKDRLRALQNGTVRASGARSNSLPDDAAMVTEAELRGAVTNDGAFSAALARAVGAA